MATGILSSPAVLVDAPNAGEHTQFLVKTQQSAQYFWTLSPDQAVSVVARAQVQDGKAIRVEVAKNHPFRAGTVSYAIGVGNSVRIEWVSSVSTESDWYV